MNINTYMQMYMQMSNFAWYMFFLNTRHFTSYMYCFVVCILGVIQRLWRYAHNNP